MLLLPINKCTMRRFDVDLMTPKASLIPAKPRATRRVERSGDRSDALGDRRIASSAEGAIHRREMLGRRENPPIDLCGYGFAALHCTQAAKPAGASSTQH